MTHTSDAALWDRLRDGDKSALQQIYDREYPYLFNYGKKVFSDEHIVLDCIHDLFVDIWQRRERLGSTDSIRKYLAASLRRNVVHQLKKTQRIKTSEGIDEIHFDLHLAIEEIIIREEMQEERAMKLKASFDQLTPKQKEILYLRFYQGLEYEQIAEVLGLQYQSLRNAVSRAIKSLRSDLVLLILLWTEMKILEDAI